MSDLPEDPAILAAEFVLGTLDPATARQVAARAGADPALRRAISAWEERLHPLSAMADEAVPPDALWQRLAASIDAGAPIEAGAAAHPASGATANVSPAGVLPAGMSSAGVSSGGVSPAGVSSAGVSSAGVSSAGASSAGVSSAGVSSVGVSPANLAASGAAAGMAARAWRSVALWRGATAAGLALAAGLAAYIMLRPPPAPPVAVLLPSGGAAPAYMAQLQPDGTLRVSALHAVAVAPGKDLELWALPQGASAPIALGVLPSQGRGVAVPNIPVNGTQLLISLEQKGGSPTGQPQGPVLYAGTLHAVD